MDYCVNNVVNPVVFADIQEIVNRDLPWEDLKNKTILITGGAGFIGYYLTLTLLALNDEYGFNIQVRTLVRNRKNAEKKFGVLLDRGDLELVVQDVCSPFEIEEHVDYVIHAASQASADYFEKDPVGTINANLGGTINVLEFAKKNDAEVLFISSLKVYGSVTDGSHSMKKDTIGYLNHLSYKNCYAQGKRTGETLCACYAQQYGMNVKIVRPSYIYGASTLDDDRVWAQFIANVVRHESILLKSNGGAYRSFCYVSDTAAAIFTVLLKGDNCVPYNISEEHSNITIRNFARTAVAVFPERNLTLSFANPEDEKEPEINYSNTPEILDNQELHQLGWNGTVTIAEGIKRSAAILENGDNR